MDRATTLNDVLNNWLTCLSTTYNQLSKKVYLNQEKNQLCKIKFYRKRRKKQG